MLTKPEIFNNGLQSFEFRRTREVRFESSEHALRWLKQLAFPDSANVSRFRALVNQSGSDAQTFRLTDEQVFEALARMLHTQQVVVFAQASQSNHRQTAAPKPVATAPAFPLSERVRKTQEAAARTPVVEPPDFDHEVASRQAAVLIQAAASGAAFCAECTKPSRTPVGAAR